MTLTYGGAEIPGLTFERHLGSGAFADVLLCEQEFPRRRVAVKILREPVSDPRTRDAFEREANLLATVSTHPSIVSIHLAAIAPSGHPYLVMEYCSRPGLAARILERPLSVPEMLQTMIRLSGAVETAHRSGILHRDLKPANVLTTDYSWPALSDFGISVVAGHATNSGGAMSLPWAAPEVVSGLTYQATSDVYGLAATAYTLLAGVSPFEMGGHRNVPALMSQILSAPVPRIPRHDVPEAVQQLLLIALSKDPRQRPQSASEFARGLQMIEQDMQLPTTHLDIPSPRTAPDDSAERTRLSPRASAPTGAAEGQERDALADSAERTAVRAAGASDLVDDRTALAAPRPAEPDDRTQLARGGRDAAAEDRTSLVRRPGSGAPEDRTAIVSRPHPHVDETVLRRGPTEHGQTGASEPWTPPPGARVAYDPGQSGAANTAYGIRDSLPSAPVTRMTPTGVASSPPRPPSSSASARQVRQRRLRWRLIAFALGAALVATAGVIAVVALTAG